MKTVVQVLLTSQCLYLASGGILATEPPSAREPSRESDNGWIASVNSRELGRRIQVIGELGFPVGTMVTIQGRWIYPKGLVKDPLPTFRVERVNGRPIEGISFPASFVAPYSGDDRIRNPKQNETWELRGYERCVMRDVPGAALKELHLAEVQQAWGFGFYSEFVHIKATKK